MYLPSFTDSAGDGWGDLPGLTGKLDYLAELGADLLWLSPIHPSPFADHGYDVADYLAVHSRYGTLGDVDRLVAEADTRDMRVLLDLVPNHTSDDLPDGSWHVEFRADAADAFDAADAADAIDATHAAGDPSTVTGTLRVQPEQAAILRRVP